jgi:hypothetical protein
MNLISLSFIVSAFLALPAAAAGTSPAPALLHLDHVLTQTLQEKAQGQLTPEQVAKFVVKFRGDLAAAKADAPPTPENTDLHARILARLGELDYTAAGAGSAPRSLDSTSALSRTHFNEETTPAVIAEEKRILASDPFNGDREVRDGVATSGGFRRFRFASRAAAANLLANLPTPPAPLNDNLSSTPAQAAGLGALVALGAAGAMLLFGGWGGDEVEKRLPGIKNRMGLAAALGGVVATAGFLLIPAVPLIAQEQPQVSIAAEEIEPYVVDEGKIVNRVWDSNWQSVKGSSSPKGSSFCEGACMPIHAQSAIERRGLNIPGIVNDARHGGLFKAVGNIPAQIRTSIDGVEAEIVIEARYLHLLKFIPESHSQLPPGGPK